MIRELNGMEINELKEYIVEIGEPKFRADQIFNFFHVNNKTDINNAGTLPKTLRDKLNEGIPINKISIYDKFISEIDETKKYLFELPDGNIIESVAMKYNHGVSICISTQVGCRMGCVFCASTQEGLIRNLTTAEMLNQIYEIENDINQKISNIVLMGSGEPLDNLENVIKFINIITNEKGHNVSKRNITLSTCGIVPKLYELAEYELPITLAISLHSAFDDERSKIMPVNKAYKLKDLIEAVKDYEEKIGRRVTFEYTLIEGVNDKEKDANGLVNLLKGLNAHINLIPLNPIKEYNREVPSNSSIYGFKKILEKNNLTTTIRREMGQDISASCGQLRRSVLDV